MNLSEFIWLVDFVTDESKHFILAFSAGWLVYSLTWITSSVFIWAWERGTRRRMSSVVVCGILISCLLLALSFGLLSHWALDYLRIAWLTPLGPHLEISLP